MSRRENASTGGSSSPIKTYLRWHGDGNIVYYDKDKGENLTLDSVDLVVLDIRSSVTGWSEENKSQITSNMVKDISKEPLTVKPFKGKEIAKGIWKDIKPAVEAADGKFTVNIIALNADNGEIVNLQLTASNLADWMNFKNGEEPYKERTSETQIFDSLLQVTAGERKKKGATKFTIPHFTLGKLSPKLDKQADEAHIRVKAYFAGFNADSRTNNAVPEPAHSYSNAPAPDPDDDLPF